MTIGHFSAAGRAESSKPQSVERESPPIGGLFIASLVHPEVRMVYRSSNLYGFFSGSDLFDFLGELLHGNFLGCDQA
jgi:hypothetical protein